MGGRLAANRIQNCAVPSPFYFTRRVRELRSNKEGAVSLRFCLHLYRKRYHRVQIATANHIPDAIRDHPPSRASRIHLTPVRRNYSKSAPLTQISSAASLRVVNQIICRSSSIARVKEVVKESKIYSFLKPREVSDFPLVTMRASPCENLIRDFTNLRRLSKWPCRAEARSRTHSGSPRCDPQDRLIFIHVGSVKPFKGFTEL